MVRHVDFLSTNDEFRSTNDEFRLKNVVFIIKNLKHTHSYFILAVWTYGIQVHFSQLEPFPWNQLIYLICEVLCMQVPSGLFVPGIISGCAFGRLTGEWVRYWMYDQNCFDTFTDCVTNVPARYECSPQESNF